MIISMLKRMESHIPVARFARRCATQLDLIMPHGERFINTMERCISSPQEITSMAKSEGIIEQAIISAVLNAYKESSGYDVDSEK